MDVALLTRLSEDDLDATWLVDHNYLIIEQGKIHDPDKPIYMCFELKGDQKRRYFYNINNNKLYYHKLEWFSIASASHVGDGPFRINLKARHLKRLFRILVRAHNRKEGDWWGFKVPDLNDFTKFAIPLVRKSFPALISQNLVSIQPMSQPIGRIFYLNQKYGTKSIKGTSQGASIWKTV
jgi:hypothetical protein